MTFTSHADIAWNPNSEAIKKAFFAAMSASDAHRIPYPHWLLQGALPEQTARQLANLPFPAPDTMEHDGRRETNNAKRVYFTPENQKKFEVCASFVTAFDHPEMRETLKRETGAALDDALLRVEYCQDTGSFWLEPHTDIAVKKFTMLIYLSDDPALANCGTDVYDSSPEHNLVHTAPYGFNGGLIFVPASDTWHGFHRRTIDGIRKSLIINYVAPDWRDRWELAV